MAIFLGWHLDTDDRYLYERLGFRIHFLTGQVPGQVRPLPARWRPVLSFLPCI